MITFIQNHRANCVFERQAYTRSGRVVHVSELQTNGNYRLSDGTVLDVLSRDGIVAANELTYRPDLNKSGRTQ